MKRRIFFLGVLAIALTTLITSCKRDYTCTCTYTSGTEPTVYNYANVSEDEADDLCQSSLAAGIGGNCTVD